MNAKILIILFILLSINEAKADDQSSAIRKYFHREASIASVVIENQEAGNEEMARRLREQSKLVSGQANDLLTVKEEKRENSVDRDIRLLRATLFDNADSARAFGQKNIDSKSKRERMIGILVVRQAAALGEILSPYIAIKSARKFTDKDLYVLTWILSSLELKLFPKIDEEFKIEYQKFKIEAEKHVPALQKDTDLFVDVIAEAACLSEYFRWSYPNSICLEKSSVNTR